VGAGAAALLEKFFVTLLKPGAMDAFSHALACPPTWWLSKMLAGKAKVASARSIMPICLFYMAGLLQVRKISGDLFTCSNNSGGKYCHQGPHLSSLSSLSRVEAEMVLVNQSMKNVKTKTKIEDAITACSTFKVWGLGSTSGRVGLLEKGEERSLERQGFNANGPGGAQGAPQGSVTGPGQYQVAHQKSAARVVEAVELEDDEALAEAIFFSEEA
jgi:hypothetical protein